MKMLMRNKGMTKGKVSLLMSTILVGSALFAQAGYAGKPLSDDLNPFGGIKAGNGDGTIPAWDGGIKAPPGNYKSGDRHVDPFPDDKVLFTITGQNVDQYKDKLLPGQVALLKQYPTYKMNVYQTRRTSSAPQKVYDSLISNSKVGQLVDGGNGVSGARMSSPFPNPENGIEAIWNHILRYRGEKIHRTTGQVNPTASGSYTMIVFDEDILVKYALPDYNEADNTVLFFMQQILEPARLAGEILLVHDTMNQVKEPRHAWTYNTGQRRVRRAPNIAYDNPGTASDGLRTNDQLDMFNGAPDRYNWTLVGRQEMYVPYNSYKLHNTSADYGDIIKAKHLNPDYMRYELHRVWVVEAALKDDTRHLYKKRVFLIDEDSWQILVADHYDNRGEIWRVAESHGINYYSVPVYWSTLDAIYDVQSGRYTAVGFDSKSSEYNFKSDLKQSDFTPDNLRQTGRR